MPVAGSGDRLPDITEPPLRHPELFPVDVNTADHETVLRVPGIGLQSAARILAPGRLGRIRFEHLKDLGVVVGRAMP